MSESRPAGKIQVAIIDASGGILVTWDDAKLAKETIARTIAEEAVEQPRFRLIRRKKLRLIPVQTAVSEALHEMSLEVARL